jgi:hypothetical protein
MDEKPKTPEQKSPREVVKAAVEYFKGVTDNVDTTKLRLEEITQDDDAWHVTLSYPQQDADSIFGLSTTRDYKEFLVDPATGNVKSMKIKKL